MKLKKIASLALAGVMAMSMLAGCAETNANSVPTTPPTATPVSGKSAVFEAALGDLADVKITMEDSADLQADLEAAAQNVGSATIIDFTTAIRAAGNVRTIANFDPSSNVYLAPSFVFTTSVPAGDLAVTADDMDAVNVQTAFNNLIPVDTSDVDDEVVTMLFAVDGFIGEDAAVKQVAEALDGYIGGLQIDNDMTWVEDGVTDHTTLHYTYTGSVSVTNRALADNHGMSLNIIAVQITRTANA